MHEYFGFSSFFFSLFRCFALFYSICHCLFCVLLFPSFFFIENKHNKIHLKILLAAIWPSNITKVRDIKPTASTGFVTLTFIEKIWQMMFFSRNSFLKYFHHINKGMHKLMTHIKTRNSISNLINKKAKYNNFHVVLWRPWRPNVVHFFIIFLAYYCVE